MKIFPYEKCRELCPEGEDCEYAQIPACTIASIYESCWLYKRRMLEIAEGKDPLADKMDRFKGFC